MPRRTSLADAPAGADPAVHPQAAVHPGAKLAKGVRVSPFAVIGENVTVGSGTEIGPHAVIEGWTVIGKDCRIGIGAVIGAPPQDARYAGARSLVVIGDRNTIREYVTIHRAAEVDHVTRLGNDNFLMAYAHVAHDCVIGDGVTIVNSVGLSGHVEVEDFAVIGGITPVHQFVRIGAYAMVGGACRVRMDVVPFAMATGEPMRIYGLNRVGLRRRGFSRDRMKALKDAFRVLFWSGLNTSDAVARLKAEMGANPDVARLVKFVELSRRGVTPGMRLEEVRGGEEGGEEA